MSNCNQELHPLLRRAILFLENKDWNGADEYCERYLDLDPECAYAYVIKLMASLKVEREEDLGNAGKTYRAWPVYQNAYRFADSELRERLDGYLMCAEERLLQQEKERIAKQKEEERIAECARKAEIYRKALQLQGSTSIAALTEAISLYKSIPGYRDSDERISKCNTKIDEERARQRALAEMTNRIKQKRKRKRVIATIIVMLVIVGVIIAINSSNAKTAQEIERNLVGVSFNGSSFTVLREEVFVGSSTLVTEMKEEEITCVFLAQGVAEIETTIRYDEEPFTTLNGLRQWDDSTRDTETVSWGDVKISLFGKITVIVDGHLCVLRVDSYNRPASVEINGITCSRE